MVSKPNILSFLIADNVIQERGTNKWSAIGIFDHIFVEKFPCIHANMALYVRLSDAEGEYDLRVEFTNSEDTKLSTFEGIKLKVLDKLATPDFGIQTRNLFIPKPDKYSFDLYFNGQLCERFPLIVKGSGK